MASEARARARVLALAVVCFVAATSVQARAEPSLSDRQTARGLMDDGDAKRDKGDLAGALKSYEAADSLVHVPTTGLEVGRTQAALGKLLEAHETLDRVTRLPVKPNETPVLTAARKSAEQLSEEIAARIPTIVVVVTNTSPPQPYDVVIDGDPIPRAAAEAPRKVNPGVHTVLVRTGVIEKKADVRVAEREQKTVSFDLQTTASEPPSSAEPSSKRRRPLPTEKILLFSGFGLAAVGVGVGTVTGLMSFSKVDDLKSKCANNQCPASEQDELDSARSLGTLSTLAFVAGGLGVGAGVLGVVLSSRRGGKAEARVTPTLGPTWVGVSGTF